MSKKNKPETVLEPEKAEIQAESSTAGVNLGNKNYLRPREIFAYCFSNFCTDMQNDFTNANHQYFALNFLEVSGTAWGIKGTVTSIWDALDDPISGIIIDRMRSRWGRIRPFMMMNWLGVITSILTFLVPSGLDVDGRMWYLIVISVLASIVTSFGSGGGLILWNMTPNTVERSKLISINTYTSQAAQWIPSLLKFAIDYLPRISGNTISQQGIYTGASVVFAILALISGIFMFLNTRERVPLPSKEDMKEHNIWRNVKMILLNNKAMYILLLNSFFGGFKGTIARGSEDFFWLNCTGKLSNGFIAGLFTGLPKFFLVPFVPRIVARFGARKTAVVGNVFSSVSYLLMFLVGYSPFKKKAVNLVWITFILTIAGLPNSFLDITGKLFTGDMYDYMEWTKGFRSEGLINAAQNYIGKLSNSVINLISGLVFDIIKYKPLKDSYGNTIPQTNKSVLRGIFIIFSLFPAFSRLMCAASISFFPVAGKKKVQMLAELNERRQLKVESMNEEE